MFVFDGRFIEEVGREADYVIPMIAENEGLDLQEVVNELVLGVLSCGKAYYSNRLKSLLEFANDYDTSAFDTFQQAAEWYRGKPVNHTVAVTADGYIKKMCGDTEEPIIITDEIVSGNVKITVRSDGKEYFFLREEYNGDFYDVCAFRCLWDAINNAEYGRCRN